MDQLSALDAGFLQAEDADPHVSLAIGGIAVIEGPAPDFDDLAGALIERLTRIPRLRQVLRTHRLDIGAPQWDERPDLDLSHHIRRAALPEPGDDAALFRLTADIIERRLDRDHPLWECWIIEGLAEGHWAILMKVHHCIADGIAAARMIAGITDEGAGAESFATDIHAAHQSRRTLQPPPFTLDPFAWARAMRDVSGTAADLTAQSAKGAVSFISSMLSPAAQTSLTGPVTTMRRYDAAAVSLADVSAICDAFDVTLNDVALAAITHGYREILVRRGEKPGRTSLRTLVPVSVRDNTALDTTDNRVAAMLPLLPVDRANPLDQLRIVHQRMTRAKSSGQRQAAVSAIGAGALVPFPLTAWTIRALTRLIRHGLVTVATNVPGPRRRQQVMGRTVLRMLPIPPIALRLRTGIAMLSYCEHLTFGIVADYDSSPDIDVLTNGIEQGVARLARLAELRGQCKSGERGADPQTERLTAKPAG